MGKIEERGKIYAIHKASDKLNDYYGNSMLSVVQFDGYDIQRAYADGYLQSEQDLEVKDVKQEKRKVIKKASEWLQEHSGDYLLYPFCEFDKGTLLEDFKKAMEDKE
jgi:hypothetical protein